MQNKMKENMISRLREIILRNKIKEFDIISNSKVHLKDLEEEIKWTSDTKGYIENNGSMIGVFIIDDNRLEDQLYIIPKNNTYKELKNNKIEQILIERGVEYEK